VAASLRMAAVSIQRSKSASALPSAERRATRALPLPSSALPESSPSTSTGCCAMASPIPTLGTVQYEAHCQRQPNAFTETAKNLGFRLAAQGPPADVPANLVAG
jgi:hypothetical protein